MLRVVFVQLGGGYVLKYRIVVVGNGFLRGGGCVVLFFWAEDSRQSHIKPGFRKDVELLYVWVTRAPVGILETLR